MICGMQRPPVIAEELDRPGLRKWYFDVGEMMRACVRLLTRLFTGFSSVLSLYARSNGRSDGAPEEVRPA